ncbi:hypothetical protein [Streptomyces sp. ALI-76-A]|uniref:hypothetical protein n=1 Tax=Streptomyces sp. ALI-76-A TaxID=3025736 RepID=UPI00256EE0EA|nr:hypothetical protein [Streptomyces sp. ALI-76-A]MDL5205305.1 hypothetical protein [Streptomyces sp. ALI-76-A]
MEHTTDGWNRKDQPMRFAFVTTEGELSFDTKLYHDIQAQIGGRGVGETGHESLRSLYPVTAYFYVPYDQDDRRMNKVANGMFWELSGPAARGTDDEYEEEPDDDYTPEDRVIKLRGPVAFIDRHNWGLSGEHENALRAAHETAVQRLRNRGWL